MVNFQFLDRDVPRSLSYAVYISQLIRFARVCSNVDDKDKVIKKLEKHFINYTIDTQS